jgi:hypothetical protein
MIINQCYINQKEAIQTKYDRALHPSRGPYALWYLVSLILKFLPGEGPQLWTLKSKTPILRTASMSTK